MKRITISSQKIKQPFVMGFGSSSSIIRSLTSSEYSSISMIFLFEGYLKSLPYHRERSPIRRGFLGMIGKTEHWLARRGAGLKLGWNIVPIMSALSVGLWRVLLGLVLWRVSRGRGLRSGRGLRLLGGGLCCRRGLEGWTDTECP